MIYVRNLVRQAHNAALQSRGVAAGSVIQNPIPNLLRQVQTLSILFQNLYHSHALLVVSKPIRTKLIQNLLSGMSKGRMAQIMTQGNRLWQILI